MSYKYIFGFGVGIVLLLAFSPHALAAQIMVNSQNVVVTQTTATITGSFDPGVAPLGGRTIEVHYGSTDSSIVQGTSDINGNFSIQLPASGSLTPGTTYSYTVYGYVNEVPTQSATYTFQTQGTAPQPPSFIYKTNPVVTKNSISLTVTAKNVNPAASYEVQLINSSGTVDAISTPIQVGPTTQNNGFDFTVPPFTGLTPNTQYQVLVVSRTGAEIYFYLPSLMTLSDSNTQTNGNGTGILVDMNANPSLITSNAITFTGYIYNQNGPQPSSVNVKIGNENMLYDMATTGGETSDATTSTGLAVKKFSFDVTQTEADFQPNTAYFFELEIPQGSGSYYLQGSEVITETGSQGGQFTLSGNTDSSTWTNGNSSLASDGIGVTPLSSQFISTTVGNMITETIFGSLVTNNATSTDVTLDTSLSTDGTNYSAPTQIFDGQAQQTGQVFQYNISSTSPSATYYVKITNHDTGVVYATFPFTTQSITTASNQNGNQFNPNGNVNIDLASLFKTVGGSTSHPTSGTCVENSINEYCPLAPLPIPGLVDATGKITFNSTTTNGVQTNNFSVYLNGMIRFIIALASAIAVVVLVVGGIKYMTSTDSPGVKALSKGMIENALIGLLLCLGSYAILNTINPNFVNGNLTLQQQNLTVTPWIVENAISNSDYQKLTGKTVQTSGVYQDKAKAAADKVGIPRCAMLTILQYESGGSPTAATAIGADENVADSGIGSRVAFIASGIKYSGAALPAGASVTDSSIRNDDPGSTAGNTTDAFDSSTNRLLLDGRFSYGIGLGQITVFPQNWSTVPESISHKNDELTITFPFATSKKAANQPYTAEDLIDADLNLEISANLFKVGYLACNQDITGAFRKYGLGSSPCANSGIKFIETQASQRTDSYNQCVASGGNGTTGSGPGDSSTSQGYVPIYP